MVETEKKNKSGKKQTEKAQQRRQTHIQTMNCQILQNNNTFEIYPAVNYQEFDDDENEAPQSSTARHYKKEMMALEDRKQE